ncbi:MAG TPA: HAD family hydrolase [Pyrinomonadaceae bacterium]
MNLKTFSAVLFDFGDTLVTLPIRREELFVRAAQSIGVTLSLEAVQHAYQIVDFYKKYSSVKQQVRAQFYAEYNALLCEVLGISSHYEKLLPAVTEEFANCPKWVLIDDAKEVLGKLTELQLSLGLVANWDANLGDVAARLQIKDYFKVIVASQAVGVEKPDPEIFRIAIGLLGSVEPESVLYVGNEYKADVVGSRAAGLTPVLIDRDDLYPHADCLRFRSLGEILVKAS